MSFIENLVREHFKYLIADDTIIKYTIVVGPNLINAFIFKDNESVPFGILRITPNKLSVKNEYTVLKIIIDNANNEELINTILKPIKYEAYSDLQIASYPYIDGEAMEPNTTNIAIFTEHLQLIRNWLVMLYNISLTNSQIKELHEDKLDWKFDRILQRSGIDRGILNELFNMIKSNEEMIINNGINKVIQHGDLRPQHILFKGNNKFTVIDWECARFGLPILDWFYFICWYFCPLPITKPITEVVNILKRLFFIKDETTQIIINETEKLFNELSIDKKLIPNFFILGIFNYLLTITFSNLSLFKDTINIFHEKDNIFK